MSEEAAKGASPIELALAELARLQQLPGGPKEFWPRYLAVALELTGADKAVLLVRKPGQVWRRLIEWPSGSAPSKMITVFLSQLDTVASQASGSGGLLLPLDPKSAATSGAYLLATKVNLQQQDECVLAMLVCEMSEAVARERLLRLRLIAATPETYQGFQGGRQSKADVEKFASVLDLTASVTAEKRFLATAMAFCNGMATRFTCDKVSLGWLEGGFIRLKAMSHTEKFDRQMAAAQGLETAMEETLDQDDEILWPAIDAESLGERPPTTSSASSAGELPGQADAEGSSTSAINRDHARYALDQKIPFLCSLPVRSGDHPVAVVLCERQGSAFSSSELQQMRLGCDLVAARLTDLRHQDLWFGARWAATLREKTSRLLGPEHTWAKVAALGISALLILLFFLRVPYRVEGSFTLRSDELSYLTAPYEGFIDEVLVRPGDHVSSNAPLVRLKKNELELEESFAMADLNRYQREAEKARAMRALAEMRIAEAMAEEATARLGTVRYRLAHATIRSPFAGVVVEGDLREHLGAPVKTAEVMLKVARIDTLYVEAEINERDIHEILGRTSGEIAFVSQPKLKFPVRIQTVEQAAMPKTEANVFLVRCQLEHGIESWWRPGMSGVCKLNVEKRSLLWILTHRTIDFLRLKLWW